MTHDDLAIIGACAFFVLMVVVVQPVFYRLLERDDFRQVWLALHVLKWVIWINRLTKRRD